MFSRSKVKICEWPQILILVLAYIGSIGFSAIPFTRKKSADPSDLQGATSSLTLSLSSSTLTIFIKSRFWLTFVRKWALCCAFLFQPPKISIWSLFIGRHPISQPVIGRLRPNLVQAVVAGYCESYTRSSISIEFVKYAWPWAFLDRPPRQNRYWSFMMHRELEALASLSSGREDQVSMLTL